MVTHLKKKIELHKIVVKSFIEVAEKSAIT